MNKSEDFFSRIIHSDEAGDRADKENFICGIAQNDEEKICAAVLERSPVDVARHLAGLLPSIKSRKEDVVIRRRFMKHICWKVWLFRRLQIFLVVVVSKSE